MEPQILYIPVFNCLTCGHSTTQRVFTKLLKPVIPQLGSKGIRCIVYFYHASISICNLIGQLQVLGFKYYPVNMHLLHPANIYYTCELKWALITWCRTVTVPKCSCSHNMLGRQDVCHYCIICLHTSQHAIHIVVHVHYTEKHGWMQVDLVVSNSICLYGTVGVYLMELKFYVRQHAQS